LKKTSKNATNNINNYDTKQASYVLAKAGNTVHAVPDKLCMYTDKIPFTDL